MNRRDRSLRRRERSRSRGRASNRPSPSEESANDKDENGEDLGSLGDDSDVQVSYVLIREGASLEEFSKLDDLLSREAKIARSRGRAEVVGGDESANILRDDESVVFQFSEGQLQIDTGYVMHFVDESLVGLPIYDIISIPDLPCYPVSETTLESLPGWAQAKLKHQGHLKCSGVYDRSTKKFFSLAPGWDEKPDNTADILAQMLEEYEGEKLARSVYYFLYRYASDQYAHPQAIAEIRGIQESSVESEIKRAEEEIDIS